MGLAFIEYNFIYIQLNKQDDDTVLVWCKILQ